ncbi:ubiquinone/menaquinone biosynthesis methyltransferase [Phorcysia thermohydrogeniphila]|uniref:Demethylmenaquinone methyltransferase n=1 Tax=Phorcysia thermohydrogeniphila TaxID=936138 RepID=A0A4R1G8Z8_9BACT|nr:ubiquinone/menaquinone biosynthesis methyltransferase [Phorcysia thermohydrogeniphila]TCK04617.1 demethylmenaquinone methyltransferase/2-methoxy-6-polyprenyl-1,4-benzoquinol methylase [Phorcysia thermohydrogeniphila]
MGKKQPVGVEIFDKIADRYDSISKTLSLGIISRWQRELIKGLENLGVTLDLACGTGEIAALVKEKAKTVIGLDYSLSMLKVARRKLPELPFVRGDALNLPFKDSSFDTVLVSLSLRHFGNTEKALAEIRRVLKRGGTVRILEVSIPQNPVLRKTFVGFLKYVLLPMGKIRSKEDVTHHLFETIVNFPHYEELIKLALKKGFREGHFKPLFFGMATVYELLG